MKHMHPLFLLTVAALAAPLTVGASEREALGKDARNWIEFQISGEAAERSPDGFSGEVAERVWQRYLDSFAHPIPERFERDRFIEGGR